ncbi:hypothetical protein FQV26_09715 [Planococcus sp. CPCC 101016]|uniref:hypothetical protein n=1 Tax=Planococcus sp. CPCC 101016 TaxID=2599617 RepID=UPI0011B77BC5|nr:hypothetical protein [Planococcus sp. CPCC 101016]TWT08065.1 hypothetical protein FQV26_09715 [Planococcus sp. CPCC 101016]
MLITLFIEATSEEKATQFSSSFVELTETYNMNTSIIKVEDYWKIDDIYKVKLKAVEPSQNQL